MSLNIGVQLTTRCNLDCTHCFVDCYGNDISMKIFKKIVLFAKAYKCSCLAFTGGEATMHPKFSEIMQVLDKNGLKFTIVSNGWNFADFYQSIKPFLTNIIKIDFSLDGATEDIHDLNRAKGSYRRVLQAISICRYKKIPFGLRMAITKRNINQLEEATLLATKVGAEKLSLIPLQPTPRTASLKLLLDPKDLKDIKEEVSRLQKIFKIKITLTAGYYDEDPLVSCRPLTMKDLYISSKGEVSFCCQLTDYKGGERGTDLVGSLEEMSLFEAHKHMIDAVAKYKKDKIQRLAEGKLSKLDYNHCWYCSKYFRKVDWMADLPDNPWSMDLIETQLGKSVKDLTLKRREISSQQEELKSEHRRVPVSTES